MKDIQIEPFTDMPSFLHKDLRKEQFLRFYSGIEDFFDWFFFSSAEKN